MMSKMAYSCVTINAASTAIIDRGTSLIIGPAVNSKINQPLGATYTGGSAT